MDVMTTARHIGLIGADGSDVFGTIERDVVLGAPAGPGEPATAETSGDVGGRAAVAQAEVDGEVEEDVGHLGAVAELDLAGGCLLYTSPSPRDRTRSRMPSSA